MANLTFKGVTNVNTGGTPNTYGVNPPLVTSTTAANAPLTAIDFDSNLKTLDSKKVDLSGYATADTIYADSSGAITKRAIGGEGTLLTPVSSSPVWALIDYSNATIEEYATAGSFTWTKPTGVKMVYVHIMAGGGGGGGGSMYAGTSDNAIAIGGGGGGAGGVIETIIDAQSLSSTEYITVGSGGAGGTGAYQLGNLNAATAGGAGQNSTFAMLIAQGGEGGGAGVAVESPTNVYTVKGGGCGAIPLYGTYAIFASSDNTAKNDEYYSMGVGGFNTFDFGPGGASVQYSDYDRNGKTGRNASGGGGAGGSYIKLSGISTQTNAGDAGGGYRAGTYTSTSSMEAKNPDYLSVYTTGTQGINANYTTFPVGGGAWANSVEGGTSTASGGGPGAGGPGGAYGGYTKTFSGSGGGALNYGGGGGGGGGCYALGGSSSRAGNGGAGSRGRVVIVCFF